MRKNPALSMFLFCHPQHWPWSRLMIPTWVFPQPHPKLRRKLAETQGTNSHMIICSHFFSRNHHPFSLERIQTLPLLHFLARNRSPPWSYTSHRQKHSLLLLAYTNIISLPETEHIASWTEPSVFFNKEEELAVRQATTGSTRQVTD